MPEPGTLRTILDISTLVGGVIAVVGGVTAVVTFSRSAKLKRAEWLYNLHAKFYESQTYKPMRRIIDYAPQAEIRRLEAALTNGGDDELAESLVDYLNFFEFIASLWKLNQLKLEEVAMVFEYYVLRVRDHKFLMTFIETEGFESMTELIDRLAGRKARMSR